MGQTHWVKMGDVYTKQIKTAHAVLTGQPSIPVFAPSFHDYFYLKPDLRSEAVVKDSEGKEWNLTDTESILADGGPNSAELESMVRLVRNKLEKEFEQTYDPDEEVDYEGTSGLVFINWQQALADASAAAINPSTCNLAESMDECARNIMQSGYTVGLVEGGTFGRHHFEEYYRALTIRNFFDQMEADGRAMRESTGGRMGRDFGTNLTALHRGAVRNIDWALNTLERNSKYVQMLQISQGQPPMFRSQVGAARRGLSEFDDFNQRVRVGLSKGWQRNDDEIDAVIKVGGTVVAGALYALSAVLPFLAPALVPVASGIMAGVGAYSGVRGSYEGGTKGALAGAASVVPMIISKGAINTNLSYTFQGGWSAGIGAQVTEGVGVGANYSEQGGWGGNVSIGLGDSPLALDLSVGEYGRYGAGLTYSFVKSPETAKIQKHLGLRFGYDRGPEGVTYSAGLVGSVGNKANGYAGGGNIGLTHNHLNGTGFYLGASGSGGDYSQGLGGQASYNWSRFGGSSTTFGITYTRPPEEHGSPLDSPYEKNMFDTFMAATRRNVDEFWGDVGGGLSWFGEQVTGGLASVAGALGWESGANWLAGRGYVDNATAEANQLAEFQAYALERDTEEFIRLGVQDRAVPVGETPEGKWLFYDPVTGDFWSENGDGGLKLVTEDGEEVQYVRGKKSRKGNRFRSGKSSGVKNSKRQYAKAKEFFANQLKNDSNAKRHQEKQYNNANMTAEDKLNLSRSLAEKHLRENSSQPGTRPTLLGEVIAEGLVWSEEILAQKTMDALDSEYEDLVELHRESYTSGSVTTDAPGLGDLVRTQLSNNRRKILDREVARVVESTEVAWSLENGLDPATAIDRAIDSSVRSFESSIRPAPLPGENTYWKDIWYDSLTTVEVKMIKNRALKELMIRNRKRMDR